ncbi:MAG: DinB family protein [Bryobacteraceae bacterium]
MSSGQDSLMTAVDGQPLWPESLRILEYLHSRAAGMNAADLRARVRAAADELERAVSDVADADARARPVPGKWTMAEVVDHMAQSTIRAADELRHLLAGRRPPGPPIYEALRSGAPAWAPWSELVDGLRAANGEVDAVLAGAADELASTAAARAILIGTRASTDGAAATQAFVAELSWKEYTLVQRLHLLEHRAQVRKLREALGH